MFNAKVLTEPLLEFGDGGSHIDPRVGLIEFGPLQPMAGDRVRLGVIGSAETADGFSQFIERCTTGIEGKKSPLTNLYPHFPGVGNQNPFRCTFEADLAARRIIPTQDFNQILAIGKQPEAVKAAVALFADQARLMLEGSSRPDVIVAALPIDLICKVVNARSVVEDDDEADDDLNFRDLFKAHMLPLSAPSQIVWPTVWDDKAKIPRKLKETLRQVQDPASRAWNLLNALFYKAGKVPWRLPRHEGEFKASYLGIGFYRDLSGQRLLTSTAQMFDERGRGLILRGARVDRQGRPAPLSRPQRCLRSRHAIGPGVPRSSRTCAGQARNPQDIAVRKRRSRRHRASVRRNANRPSRPGLGFRESACHTCSRRQLSAVAR
jgi:hypothetical protein